MVLRVAIVVVRASDHTLMLGAFAVHVSVLDDKKCYFKLVKMINLSPSTCSNKLLYIKWSDKHMLARISN